MLTEQQIQHSKYGKLLADVIKVWKKPNMTPCYKYLGIAIFWGFDEYREDEENFGLGVRQIVNPVWMER